ncbi:hypothetical protein TNCV_3070621 [Trichonephila clavipes]|nr:hypothetical protein TNCV_3070621 [Trichonephila clavipes]
MIKQGVDSSNGPKQVAVVPDFHKRILFSDESALLVEWLRQQTKLPHLGAVVPTRRRNMSHSSCHNRFIAIRLVTAYFTFWTCELASKICGDLTPLDYFLWDYAKSLVYADRPQTLTHLEDNIRRVIADIRPQMLEKVIENWTSRLDYIRASHDSHMPEIIFKIQCHKIIFRKKFMSVE